MNEELCDDLEVSVLPLFSSFILYAVCIIQRGKQVTNSSQNLLFKMTAGSTGTAQLQSVKNSCMWA
jgi:hypothetical protein